MREAKINPNKTLENKMVNEDLFWIDELHLSSLQQYVLPLVNHMPVSKDVLFEQLLEQPRVAITSKLKPIKSNEVDFFF